MSDVQQGFLGFEQAFPYSLLHIGMSHFGAAVTSNADHSHAASAADMANATTAPNNEHAPCDSKCILCCPYDKSSLELD